MLQTRLCELFGIRHPVVLGGMGSATDANLATAVSKAGGLGIVGCVGRSPAWIAETARAIRASTDRPFGLNLLLFETDPPAAPAIGWSAVTDDEREVGRVTSIAWLPDGGGSLLGRWIGLAVLRREVPVGAVVRASGREARVVDLPFAVPSVRPA